jgi:hypothetical protein
MQPFLKIASGLTIAVMFFFGTLFALDFYNPASTNNRIRARHINMLSNALEKYHQARGTYPTLQSNPVDDLKKELVDGGFVEAIPTDPARPSKGQQYLYAGGANTYGLLVTLEPQPFLTGTKPAFTCVVGVKIRGSGAWGNPPACRF